MSPISTDGMTDLVAFLRARLDEDEAAADAALYPPPGHYDKGWQAETLRKLAARVLAEVEAKRRIVDRYEANLDRQTDPEESQLDADIIVGEYEDWTLPAIAWPYADHPDYAPAWRP